MNPSDNTTLSQVLANFAAGGWDGNFGVTDGARIRCPQCRTESSPQDVIVDRFRRMEGASDPADMLAVVALECPECSTKGVVILNYGPTAEIESSEVLRFLEDRTPETPGAAPNAEGQ